MKYILLWPLLFSFQVALGDEPPTYFHKSKIYLIDTVITGYIQFHPGVIFGDNFNNESTFDFTEPGHGSELLSALKKSDRPVRIYEYVFALETESKLYGPITLTQVSDRDVYEINASIINKIQVEEVVEVFYPRTGIGFIPKPLGFWNELTPKSEYQLTPWNYYHCGIIVLDFKNRSEIKALIDRINDYQKNYEPPFSDRPTPESKLEQEKWIELISLLKKYDYLIYFSPTCND